MHLLIKLPFRTGFKFVICFFSFCGKYFAKRLWRWLRNGRHKRLRDNSGHLVPLLCFSAPLLLVLVAMPCVWRTISNLIINLIKCLSAISIQNKLPTATETEEEGEPGKADTSIPLRKKTTINTHVCVSLRVCVKQPAVLGALTNDCSALLAYPPKKRTCWESTFH